MRYVSLFSGIEAASVAWPGWEPVAFCEIDKFPSAVLAERFTDVPNLGDITKVGWRKYAGSADVVVGGSPCQSFSVAGKREGLAGASGLMFEYIRAVSEIMPACFVWENVPGALSSEGGAAFGQLLREMDDLGYGLAWRVLDAQFFGVAQRRRRVFLIGCLGDPQRAAEILFEPEGLRWDHPSSRVKRQELAGAAWSGACGGCECMNTIAFDTTQITSPQNGNRPQIDDPCHPLCAGAHVPAVCMASGQANAEIGKDLCPAQAARQHKDPPIVVYTDDGTQAVYHDGLYWVVRRLMPVECERLQGFPDGWTRIPWRGKTAEECPDGPRYKALGNSMAVPVMRWIGERIEMTA